MGTDVTLAAMSVVVPTMLGLALVMRGRVSLGAALLPAFLGGAAVAGATWGWLVLQGAFTDASRVTLEGALAHAFAGAALPEETAKLGVLFLALHLARRWQGAPTILHGLLAGLALGLGFAALENLVYGLQTGPTNGAVRLLTAVPCHAFLGAVMGHYVAAFFAERSWLALAKAWIVPAVAHGLYNLPLVLDPAAFPATASSAGEEMLLSAMVLLWLAVWTRYLLTVTSRAGVEPVL